MDITTQEALELVTRLKEQADAQIDTYTKISEGHKIIMDRLNGIKETPAADYVAIQKEVETLGTQLIEKDAQVTTLSETLDIVTVEKEALEKQVVDLTAEVAILKPVEEKPLPVEEIIP